MTQPPTIGTDDPARITALKSLGLLDTPPEERFDRITRVLSRLLAAPVAFISLVDVHRQWFKSCIGLDFSETPVADSFCTHALAGEVVLVEDARRDSRFCDNPLVTEPPYLRAYAGQPLRSVTGHVVGTLCVMDFVPRTWAPGDVAALVDMAKWAETELASSDLEKLVHDIGASERRQRAIMDSAGEGIVVMGPTGETQSLNAAAERILGHARGALVGHSFHDVVHHTHPDGTPFPFTDCLVATTLADGAMVPPTADTFWHADGSPVPVEMSCAPLLEDGGIAGAVLVFRDVSERRELEAMKDRFVSSVSHELRTPLTAIKGYLEEVLEGEAGPLNDDQREDLEIVARNAARLQALIDDLLLLSRMDARRIKFERTRVDLGRLVGELVEDLGPAIQQQGGSIEVDLTPGLLTQGDEKRLRQALANLLANAVKFNCRGRPVRVRGSAEADTVLVAISDEGVGIPAGELSRLTERFFRASTAGAISGTGLGLAITKEIVERHGGQLEIESRQGEGSTFALRLPRAE